MSSIFKNYEDEPQVSNTAGQEKEFEANIDKEIAQYRRFISDQNNLNNVNTIKFWNDNLQYPYLSKLSKILLNINSSSACIERFFSICGLVCDKRRGSMKKDLIIMRSMIKTNMSLLQTLNKTR